MSATRFLLLSLLLLFTPCLYAEDDEAANTTEAALVDETLTSLADFIELEASLEKDIAAIEKALKSPESEAQKEALTEQLQKLESDLASTRLNFEKIAAGTGLKSLRAVEEQKFNFQQELLSLLEPAVKEMKEMTSHVRQKSDLKETIAYYSEKLPIAEKAVASLENLIAKTGNKAVREDLEALLAEWQKQQTFMQSEKQAAELQLEKLLSSETSFAESSGNYLKSFFQKRGRYLLQALFVVIAVLIVSRLSYKVMTRLIPGYRREHRSFGIRVLDLFHRLFTILLVIAGPMLVFYTVEDWVLFSISILLLIGIAWTLGKAMPHYWQQVQLFLNIGSVREGERLIFNDLPWKVKQINFFSTLENPVAKLTQRIPLGELVDMKSRPLHKGEPWFPCKKGDWVILSDGVRGKVIGISPELVQLVEDEREERRDAGAEALPPGCGPCIGLGTGLLASAGIAQNGVIGVGGDGAIGSTFGVGLIIGGVYLIIRGIIRWEISLAFLAGVYATALLFNIADPVRFAGPGFHVVTGYTLIGALFLATDDASSPVWFVPMLIYGAIGGIMTVLIRNIGAYVDGVIFAILLINLINPLVDKIRPKAIGKVA